MKKYIAISCLFALLLAGCKQAEEPKKAETQPVAAATEAITETQPTTLPEQVVSAEESTLAGSWEGVISMGRVAAERFLKNTDIALTEISDITYPVSVKLDLYEDGHYYFEVQPDTSGTGFASFVSSFHRALTEQGIADYTEEQLWDMMRQQGLDQIAEHMSFYKENSWEENDQGLFLADWCTVQFTLAGEEFTWISIDDEDFAENLPIPFRPAK